MAESTADVAIVGMGAVFPGAGDAPSFWRNIRSGHDAIGEVSPDRWDPAVYCSPEAGADRFYTTRGGFLGDLASFDPAPFGIMPNAVEGTEPDQLLMLRSAAEALADAGDLPADRERVGVIIGRGGYLTPGVSRLDTQVRTAHQLTSALTDIVPGLSVSQVTAVREAFAAQLSSGSGSDDTAIGLVPNFAASRLANRFDLRGPAYTVDAACASSLIAVDHAVRELATGRCDAVLAGGVHTCHHPTLWSVFTRLKALSPAGVIRPLSAGADGTLLSEGTGAVLLKRLDDARAAGDRIYAVIRGVGISSDGRGASMMSPALEGQELAIRRAWASAGLDPLAPDALGLVEAHGTATRVGDRTELTALGQVFGDSGPSIGIGTVKSMIGHAMPAAGIAGLIKTAYAVHEGVLPPTLHVGEPNPALAGSRFAPVTSAREWDASLPRRATVSAFGFGGINAHVILEADASPSPSAAPATPATPALKFAKTAVPATETANIAAGGDAITPGGGSAEPVLRLAADSPAEMAALLDAPDDELLARAGTEPGDGPCRLAIVGPDTRKLKLSRKVARRGTPWRGRSDLWFTPSGLLQDSSQVAFLFPGFEPEFAPRIEGVASAFGLEEPALHRATAGTEGDGVVEQGLDVIAVSRLYAGALAGMGITPGALAGHSLGEWTAMVAAGIYPDIDDFMATLRPGMVEVPDVVYLALGASASRAAELADDLDGVVLTHDNCPRQSVVCGPSSLIEEAAERCREAGILAQVLPFRTGFHSPVFAPFTPPIRESLQALEVQPPRVPIWSATSLAEFPRDPDDMRDLVLRHLVEPVRFRQLTEMLHGSGIRAFVQVGPGSLTGFADDTLSGQDFLTVSTATPKKDGLAQLRRAAAALWAEGLSPRFDRLKAGAAPAAPAASSAAAPSRPVSGKPVRLRLGDPFVRLEGVVPPLAPGDGGGPVPAVPSSDPLYAELNALLAETSSAASDVVSALRSSGAPAPAPAPPALASPSAPAPAAPPRAVGAEREFSLRTMPDIADHCIFPQPDGWPDDTDRFPVVPATTLLEIMGDAALELAPGKVVTGFEQVRALRWLAVAPATRTVVRAAWAPGSSDRVRVAIEGYATGYVRVADSYPAAPAPDTRPLSAPRPAPVNSRQLYDDVWMFHGPKFAGVSDIAILGDDGITGTVLALPARGALLDSAGQLIGHWMQVSRTVDQTVLPTGIGAVRFFGPQPPAGQALGCTARITELTDTEMTGDIELTGPDGRVWCRIDGWTTRRFATDDAIWAVKFHPETNTLSLPAGEGWHVVHENWPDTASRDLMMRRYLNAAERADYDRLNPLQQRRWLLGRIAVKDATRRYLWEHGTGPVYPCELTVTETDGNFQIHGPFRAPPVTVTLSPPDHPGRPYAAAAAGDSHGAFDVDALQLKGRS
ncbi:MAG: polyketide synthase dehydratase domain-containing protein [Streptosporangiales bacterium]|nr:polyketide synthase dehydratase domain-containing protein [Streptosporangiales bacterium]